MAAFYRVRLSLPERVPGPLGEVRRVEFLSLVWSSFGQEGLQGIHEGSMAPSQAARLGFETDSWVLDAALAPQKRDWVSRQKRIPAQFYFSTRAQASAFLTWSRLFQGIYRSQIQKGREEDWLASWKRGFSKRSSGIRVGRSWWILPEGAPRARVQKARRLGTTPILIRPGAGFGTGGHATTRLCLQAIAQAPVPRRALDFGSGSGILSIALALRGSRVDAVEIDPLARQNARENAGLNHCGEMLSHRVRIPSRKRYELVVANILKPILLKHAPQVIGALESRESSTLILSGLLQDDIAEILSCYEALLKRKALRILKWGEWRAIQW